MTFPSFSKRQMLALTWWNRPAFSHYDVIICDGAVRSGKTVSTVGGFFLWSMANFDQQVFALCGKSVSSLRRNIIIHLAAWLGGGFFITEHRGENKLTVRCGEKENTYYLFGGQDESSYMSVQGITLAGVLLDEVALMPRSFVEQACARCSVPGSKLWFNCNPAGPEHWFYKEWILRAKEKRALHLHFTMADNPGLDPEVRARYERLYRGVFYDRYVGGKWCLAEGLVYDFCPEKHITEKIPHGRYYISVDYGTMNPFSAGLWCVGEGKAVRVREFYYNGWETGKALTDEEDGYVGGTFDGLRKLLAGTANEMVSTVDLTTSEKLDANYNAFLDEMESFISALDGTPTMLLMNRSMLIKLRSIARRAGYYERKCDDFGHTVETYAGIPMVDMGQYFDGQKVSDVIALDGGKTCIYAVCMGLDGFHGISPTGDGVIQSYLPDLSAPGAVKTGEVELVAGVALKNTLKAAVLKDIAIAGA